MSEEKHIEEVRGILFGGAVATALDFKEKVVDWIMLCRVEDGGVPSFRTQFAKHPFKSGETLFVMGVCWLGSGLVKSQWFSSVPKGDWEHLTTNTDDYTYLLQNYSSTEMLKKAIKAPLVVV